MPKLIPKYQKGKLITYSNPQLLDNSTLSTRLSKVVNTNKEGEYNPFYSSLDDTYGTVPLLEVKVTAPLTEKAQRKIEARRGESYVDAGRRKAAPYIGAIVGGAALGAMGSAGMLSQAITPIDIGFIYLNPKDPLNYLPAASSVTRNYKRIKDPLINTLTKTKDKARLIHKDLRIINTFNSATKNSAIIDAMKTYPELGLVGTTFQYGDYINNIFPESKLNTIFYHGGKKGILKFHTPKNKDFTLNKKVHSGTKDHGIYFTGSKELAKNYLKVHPKNDRQLYRVKLDLRNPYSTNDIIGVNIRSIFNKDYVNPGSITDRVRYGKLKDNDSVIWAGLNGEVIVFDPKLIHILGNKDDLNMFSKYTGNNLLGGNKIEYIPNKPPKRLIKDDKTVPAYFGKKYSVSDVVNPDGTINVRTALKILQETAKHYGVPPMQKRIENPVWHKDDPNTFLHTKKVTKNAWNLPIPPGYTKQDLMISAIGHDFGKIVAGDGHGPAGAGLLKQIFPDLTDDLFKAIYLHMNPIDEVQGNLAKYTKYADIGLLDFYYSYPITNNPMRYVKDGKYDTSLIVSDFKKGIEEARRFLNSDTYKLTALRNIQEAENLGLHYTPTTNSDGFKSLMNDGVKLEIDTKMNAGGATSMFGGSIGTPTPVIINPKSKLNYTALHEGLHVGEFGKAPKKMIGESDLLFLQRAKKDALFLKHKVNEVFKDTDAGVYDFSSQTGEAATNMLDVGKRLNIKWGQEYPGDELLISMLKSFEKSGDTKSGIVSLLKLNTPEGRLAVWRALNGTLFVAIPSIGSFFNSKK